MKFGNFIDMLTNEIRNHRLHTLSSTPGSPVEGQVYYNSTDKHPHYINDGPTDKDLTDAEKLGGQTSAFHLARANHSGTQAASTVSDFDTQVRTNRLDQLSQPTASIPLNGQKFTGAANGSSPQDLATVAQVDQARQGIRSKAPVEVAASVNVTIANPGTDTFQTITLANGEAILLPNQTTATEKGIYIFNGSGVAMTRRDDADSFDEIDGGTEVFVQGGDNSYAGKLVRQLAELTSFASQDWQVVGAGTTYTAGNGLTESPAGTFNVGAGTGMVSNANDVALDTSLIPRMFSALVGDNAAATFNIAVGTHGLGAGRKKIVQVYEEATGNEIGGVVDAIEADGDVLLAFATIPTTNQYRVNILGIV